VQLDAGRKSQTVLGAELGVGAEFSGTEDKLYALFQGAGHDFDGFRAATGLAERRSA
jgi:hypothetical protein